MIISGFQTRFIAAILKGEVTAITAVTFSVVPECDMADVKIFLKMLLAFQFT